MEENKSKDIRRLLKTFGVKADEQIQAFLEMEPKGGPLKLRITLEDVTDDPAPIVAKKIHLVVEDEVQRGSD